MDKPQLNETSVRELVMRVDPHAPPATAMELLAGSRPFESLADPFLKRTADIPDDEFLRWVYFIFLDRASDSGGFNSFLTGLKAKNISRSDIVKSFISSDEFKRLISSDRNVFLETTAAGMETVPKNWMPDEDAILIPPRSMWIGPNDSIGHYLRWGWEYRAYLTLLCGLRRSGSVLEVGCGHGRSAAGLFHYLIPPARYVGLDVDRRLIEDARNRITPVFHNFQFVWADVYSHQYNPSGKSNGENYRFPVEAGSFDAIFAASLFTHLLPAETLNYFRQCRLALKPGGKCLFSFFLLDRYGGRDKVISPSYEFEYPLEGYPGVASRNPIHPSETIAYNSATVKAIAAQAGLAVTNEVPGYWSTTSDFAVNEQDLIVLAAV